jgi:type II secretory pathway component PulF
MSTDAITFAYEGRDSLGNIQRGVQIAASDAEAMHILESEPDPITVHTLTRSLSERLSLGSIITAIRHQLQERGVHAARLGFYRLAVSFLKRGTHVRDAVAQYLLECPSPRFKATLRDVLQRTGVKGSSFPDALAAHPGEFPRQHVEMLRIPFNEKRSPLPTFERLRKMDTMMRRRSARDVIGRISFYFSYLLSGLGVIYVSYYYLPNLEKWIVAAHGRESAIPGAVRFLAAAGSFLTSLWGVVAVIATIVLLRMAWRSLMQHRRHRLTVERVKWGVPLIGARLREAELLDDRALALSYLSSMRFTGVEDMRALRLTADAVVSVQFGDALMRQAARVEEGIGFIDSFGTEVEFWTGEVTGLLGRAKDDFVPLSDELAGDFEEEAQAAAAMTSAFKSFGHLIAATLLAGLVSATIYFAGFAVLQALGKQYQ